MNESILPISGEPVYKLDGDRFTHVTVDVTNTKNGRQLVVFVSTQSGSVMKLAVLPRFNSACLVEIWRLKDQRDNFDVQAMQFVKETVSRFFYNLSVCLSSLLMVTCSWYTPISFGKRVCRRLPSSFLV